VTVSGGDDVVTTTAITGLCFEKGGGGDKEADLYPKKERKGGRGGSWLPAERLNDSQATMGRLVPQEKEGKRSFAFNVSAQEEKEGRGEERARHGRCTCSSSIVLSA